ncbi:MAG: hypothetical protein D3925_18840, partial [Candidatus Electrothrix sp. AR5]|nr:hypothetical protein [Candidatus Electrothrix sp. AR5]
MTEKQDKNMLQDLPDNQARRKTIKKLVIGAGALAGYSMLPEKWTKPVVEQIILPAHAQTSGITLVNPLTLTLLSGTQSSATVSIRVSGAVHPPTANRAVFLVAQRGLVGGTTRHPSLIPEKNILQEAVATVQDFLVSEAVAAEPCPQLTQQVTSGGDGSFSADFEIGCGPGITSVSATATLSASSANAAEGILLIPAADSDSSPVATTESSASASAYSFTNNSSGTVTVEWETPDRTDTVGPGESVEAPIETNASTNIWVTGTNY